MRIEIQIRTKLQHAWATSVETLGVIDKVSYKSGLGDEENIKFFKIVLFSIKEHCNVLDEYKQYTQDELIQMLKDVEQKQQILAKLKGLSTLKPVLNLNNFTDVYFVLLLAVDDQKEFSIKIIPFDDKEQAALHYDALEKKIRNSSDKSVVLVRSKNLKELKKAYPNYFLDTQYFVRIIKDMIK